MAIEKLLCPFYRWKTGGPVTSLRTCTVRRWWSLGLKTHKVFRLLRITSNMPSYKIKITQYFFSSYYGPGTKPSTWHIFYIESLQQAHEVCAIIIPIVQMRKLRPKDIKWLTQSDLASQCRARAPTQARNTPEHKVSTILPYCSFSKSIDACST